jgi:hypothetical protein
MMPLEAARHHARLDIAAQAQLQTELISSARNLALGLVVVPDDVAEAVRLPGEQGAQLGGGCAGGSFCEVECDAEACGAGSLEDRGIEGYFALGTDGWVAAEV